MPSAESARQALVRAAFEAAGHHDARALAAGRPGLDDEADDVEHEAVAEEHGSLVDFAQAAEVGGCGP